MPRYPLFVRILFTVSESLAGPSSTGMWSINAVENPMPGGPRGGGMVEGVKRQKTKITSSVFKCRHPCSHIGNWPASSSREQMAGPKRPVRSCRVTFVRFGQSLSADSTHFGLNRTWWTPIIVPAPFRIATWRWGLLSRISSNFSNGNLFWHTSVANPKM